LKRDGSWVASEEGWESRRGIGDGWMKRDGWLTKVMGVLKRGWVA
jgi:hypothetical protein